MFHKFRAAIVALAVAAGLTAGLAGSAAQAAPTAPAVVQDAKAGTPPSFAPGTIVSKPPAASQTKASPAPSKYVPVRKPIPVMSSKILRGPTGTYVYYYAGAWQLTSPVADTFWSAVGNATVNNPWVGGTPGVGAHSLNEIAVWNGSGSTRNIVEIGWCVNCKNDGDMSTRLFVYAWRNGVPIGSYYNAPGAFTPYCAVPGTCAVPGDILTGNSTTWNGTSLSGTKTFQIQQTNNGWWFAYDGKWIGSIPNTWWTSVGATFTAGSIADFFGEVATQDVPNCDDMGNSLHASSSSSAYWTTVQVNAANPTSFTAHQTNSSMYSAAVTPPRSVRYGGGGLC
jgi:hypothetical protein